LEAFNDNLSPYNGDPRGPAGTIVGFFTPTIYGPISTSHPITALGTFDVLIGTGCFGTPLVCGTGWNLVKVPGKVTVLGVVPEPGTFALLALGLLGLGIASPMRKRRWV
jgi:hypothetical protein